MILDGYGLNDKVEGNAVKQANTPVMDDLMANCPFVEGQASGMAVGLPEGQMGNSEVGHLNMGAGRIVYQELTRITKAIQDGDFFENPALMSAINGLGKSLFTFMINVTGLLVRIGGVFFAIPKFGIQGYLWGLLASQFVVTGLSAAVLLTAARPPKHHV